MNRNPSPLSPQAVPAPVAGRRAAPTLCTQDGRAATEKAQLGDTDSGQASAQAPIRDDSASRAIGEDELNVESDGAPSFDPHVVWQMLLSELALQMPSATYDTWVRDTVVIGYEDGEFIIGMPNAYARDWLENRLRHTIKRTLSSILHRSVQVQFRVRPRPVVDPAAVETAPLYRTAEETRK